jgi:GMP reductase
MLSNLSKRFFASSGPRRGEIVLLSQRKLNFADVMIVPQKSFVTSRSNVNISSTYKFKYASHERTGVPIISSNMDTVTNVNTAALLAEYGWLSTFPKHFN